MVRKPEPIQKRASRRFTALVTGGRHGTSFPEAIQNEIFLNSGAFMRIYPDCSSAIRLDEPFELLAPLISQVVITTVTSGAVVQSQSVC